MRTRTTSTAKPPRLALAAALLLLAPPSLRAQSNNPKSQLVSIPNPTPRETDPHLLLGDTSRLGAQNQSLVEQQNAKRRELVAWAANELVALAARVQLDLDSPKTPATMALAAANTEKIEHLAKNLSAALKAR